MVMFMSSLPRIIPARAGNAHSLTNALLGTQDHPRAGGERLPSGDLSCVTDGSSPRGRGTPP